VTLARTLAVAIALTCNHFYAAAAGESECESTFHAALATAIGSTEKCALAFEQIRCADASREEGAIASADQAMKVLRASEGCPTVEPIVVQRPQIVTEANNVVVKVDQAADFVVKRGEIGVSIFEVVSTELDRRIPTHPRHPPPAPLFQSAAITSRHH
jgi:hypothetical protein